MKVSYKWLNDFCKCPEISTLISDFNKIGFEIEGVENKGQNLSNIITGKIISFEGHPDADRLRVAKVDIKSEIIQLVTAAQNVNKGDIIPVSLPGAILASGLKIKKSKLRGIESNGMMCSAIECGLTDDADGVWVLPKDTPIGVDFIEFAELKDTILDVSVLPNRGDCLSIFGLARECSALYGNTLKDNAFKLNFIDDKANINIKLTKEISKFYQATKITGIDTSAETPLKIQTRLYYCGMRPISWLVDVTNYVMLEFGQPLHAFDAENLNSIAIEFGSEKDQIHLLNDKKVKVNQLPIIRINDKVGAIAGVMGAIGSEVTNKTSEIVLESAIFDPIITRKASQKIGLRSESSNRFEKGRDFFHLNLSVSRVIELISENNSNEISIYKPEIINNLDNMNDQIKLDINQMNTFLGTEYNINNVINRLTPLGFEFNDDIIAVPEWRLNDCLSWPDIAEEMFRFDGMATIAARTISKMVPISHDPLYQLQQTIREICFVIGLTEVIPFPLQSSDVEANQLIISNPISEDLSILRSNGIQGLLECAKFNSLRHNSSNQIFSIGPTWSSDCVETLTLSIFIQGPRQYEPFKDSEYHTKNYDFYDAKGIIEKIIRFKSYNIIRSNSSWFHPGQSADILMDNEHIASFGVIHPSIQEKYKCGHSIAIDINLTKLHLFENNHTYYETVSKFPSTTRDVTYITDQSVSLGEILTVLNDKKPDLCKAIHFCGYYQPSKSPEVNISFRMIYQDNSSSCNTEEVNKIHKEFAESVIKFLPCRFP